MNIVFWILQVLLALHTAIGGVWKFSNPAQNIPSLAVIPSGMWLGLAVLELSCALDLVLPALVPRLGIVAPAAAVFIAAEMLVFSALHLSSGQTEHGPMIYWLVTAVFAATVAYGRFVLVPH